MTYAAHSMDFGAYAHDDARPRDDAVAKKRGILRRLFGAIMETRQRETNRQIARFLARSGGRFTDDVERELMRRVSTSNWDVHR